jgi:hypothetical protein
MSLEHDGALVREEREPTRVQRVNDFDGVAELIQHEWWHEAERRGGRLVDVSEKCVPADLCVSTSLSYVHAIDELHRRLRRNRSPADLSDR